MEKPTRSELLNVLNLCAQPGRHPPGSVEWVAAVEAQKIVYKELGLNWSSAYIDQANLKFEEEGEVETSCEECERLNTLFEQGKAVKYSFVMSGIFTAVEGSQNEPFEAFTDEMLHGGVIGWTIELDSDETCP